MKSLNFTEINIDGLIGPTHHYGGLGVGNIASHSSQQKDSNPRAAALEGLAKMRLLDSLDIPQFHLPPLMRPNWPWLESLGFTGDRADALKRCFDLSPTLLSAATSSAFMWTANAATVAPSCDTHDQRLQLVPANLCCNLHRGQETMDRRDQLRALFAAVPDAIVHEPLPSVYPLRDEGAANHIRVCDRAGLNAVHLFVYGPPSENSGSGFMGRQFMGRQSELASRQVAKALQVMESDLFFVQQTVQAIDAGVFHNDVISMSNGNLLIYHEHAFEQSDTVIASLASRFHRKTNLELKRILVSNGQLSLDEAVKTYLFNSQLISTDPDEMQLICPEQCQESEPCMALIQGWIDDATNPIKRVHFMSLNESMANGGGPACLRLRASLSGSQLQHLNKGFRADAASISELTQLIERWYPSRLTFSDLSRIDFAEHSMHAVAAIWEHVSHFCGHVCVDSDTSR
ncbi:MAG: N-succinylarginine dihydrolase [Pirellula sp.]